MKYEMTAEDVKVMQTDMQSNRTLQHLRDINFYKFSVGDVLLRQDKYGDTWKTKTASCGLPYKYVYAFENELGVGYIRRLSVNGRKFVETPVCVVHFDPGQTQFQLDPAYANHILLSAEEEEFDVKGEYSEAKKRREQMHRKNDKIAEKITTVQDAVTFLGKLKAGDHFWRGYSLRSVRKDPVYVVRTEIKAIPLEHESFVEWSYNPPTTNTGMLPYYGYGNYTITAERLVHERVWLTKPLFLEDIIS